MLLISICTICILLNMFYGSTRQRKMLTPQGETRIVTAKQALIMFALILIVTSTLRYGFIDTYAYKILYRASRDNLDFVNNAPWGVETGWLYLMYYLNFISDSPKLMLFLVALSVNVAYVLMSKKYSSNALFSLFVYFCIGYMDTNNGLRQCFAASITMMAFPLLLSKRYVWYALCVAFASVFHESAIYVLAVALLVLGKPFNLKMIFALLAGVVFLFAPGAISGLIKESMIDSKYNDYLNYSNGMGFLRCFIISILPLTLAALYCVAKRGKKEKISYQDGVLINMLIMNSIFYLMGMHMQYWARLAFYTSFAPIVLLPKLIDGVFARSDRQWLKPVALCMYFVFFAYNIYVNIAYGAMKSFRIEWF